LEDWHITNDYSDPSTYLEALLVVLPFFGRLATTNDYSGPSTYLEAQLVVLLLEA
jgi:hypothetical protein